MMCINCVLVVFILCQSNLAQITDSQLNVKILEISDFSGTVTQFLKEYVAERQPVKIGGVYNEFKAQLDLNHIDTPQAVTTYLHIMFDGEKQLHLSIRNVMSMIRNNTPITINTNIPDVLKTQLIMPKFLTCDPVKSNLQETKLIFDSLQTEHRTISNEEDSFACLLSGNAEYFLIDTDFKNLDAKDETIYRYHRSVNKGDCIFIPSNWLAKWSTDNETLLISLSWKTHDFKTMPNFVSTCEEISDNYLISVKFRKEPKPDILQLLKFHKLHHIIDFYFIPIKEDILTFETFEELLKQDEFTEGVFDWNEECKAIAEEMFQQLDKNSDGNLSFKDFSISYEEMEQLAGQMNDRYQDFHDIIKDQDREKKPFARSAQEAFSKHQEDSKNAMLDEFKDIFKELEDITRKAEEASNEKSASTEDSKSENSPKDEL